VNAGALHAQDLGGAPGARDPAPGPLQHMADVVALDFRISLISSMNRVP